jgi:predicted NBD/HSP70 family sugar kinase
MFDALKKTVKERAFKIASDKAKIVPAKLGNDAGIIGAATIAMVHHKYGHVPFGTDET